MTYSRIYTAAERAAWAEANTTPLPTLDQKRLAFWKQQKARQAEIDEALAQGRKPPKPRPVGPYIY